MLLLAFECCDRYEVRRNAFVLPARRGATALLFRIPVEDVAALFGTHTPEEGHQALCEHIEGIRERVEEAYRREGHGGIGVLTVRLV